MGKKKEEKEALRLELATRGVARSTISTNIFGAVRSENFTLLGLS
jgi:hypothetical protein